jgi:cytochrome c oxidase subunit 1
MRRCAERRRSRKALLAVNPPQHVPAALNGFGLWNVLVLVLMLLAYVYPVAQFVITPSPSAMVHRIN